MRQLLLRVLCLSVLASSALLVQPPPAEANSVCINCDGRQEGQQYTTCMPSQSCLGYPGCPSGGYYRTFCTWYCVYNPDAGYLVPNQVTCNGTSSCSVTCTP